VQTPHRASLLHTVKLLSGTVLLFAAATAGPVTAQPPAAISEQTAVRIVQDKLQADRHYRNGLAYGEQGRFTDAARELSAAVALDPTDADAHVSLAEADAELGRFDEAVTALQRALALSPNHLDAHYDLSRIYLQRGQFDQAWRHARTVQRLNPAMANTLIGQLRRVAAPIR